MSPEEEPRRPLAPLPEGLPPAVAALANEMRRGRDEVDLSLSELARKVYSSKASVSRWLSGVALPTRDQAQRWAEVCGTDRSWMSECWDALDKREEEGPVPPRFSNHEGGVETALHSSGDPTDRLMEEPGRRPNRRIGSRLTIIIGAVLTVSALAFTVFLHSQGIQRCRSPRIALQVPSMSGSSMGMTMHVNCATSSDRTYLLIEEVPHVDPGNPHSVYFVKAYLSRPERDSTESHQLLLEEPVGTKAKFYVISVDESGSHAIEQNRVVDEGIIELPRGTQLESDVIWHVKKWQDS